ncbi:MAG: alpha-L-rhamnosidase, partial [Candidatus Omnitrophica bacterium]|nr:alpha-L-rhamnosidase [Candidatus Omnitrophota bacterium]
LGRTDVIVKDWRERWATMSSVVLNNSLQEWWTAKPDSSSLWSHCPVSPVFVLYMDIAGIRPTSPGFDTCVVRPQLSGFGELELTSHTPHGPIHFAATPENGGHRVTVTMPEDCEGELLLPSSAHPNLEALAPDHPLGLKRFRLPPGSSNSFLVPN